MHLVLSTAGIVLYWLIAKAIASLTRRRTGHRRLCASRRALRLPFAAELQWSRALTDGTSPWLGGKLQVARPSEAGLHEVLTGR